MVLLRGVSISAEPNRYKPEEILKPGLDRYTQLRVRANDSRPVAVLAVTNVLGHRTGANDWFPFSGTPLLQRDRRVPRLKPRWPGEIRPPRLNGARVSPPRCARRGSAPSRSRSSGSSSSSERPNAIRKHWQPSVGPERSGAQRPEVEGRAGRTPGDRAKEKGSGAPLPFSRETAARGLIE